MFSTNKVPTDLEILEYIYKNYYQVFESFDRSNPQRDAKIYVPIDCKDIGNHFKVDSDIIFGRLYYHLEKKYSYSSDNATVHFFANRLKEDIKCINFPYMASVLSELQDNQRKFTFSLVVSVIAISLSSLSLGITAFDKLNKTKDTPVIEIKSK